MTIAELIARLQALPDHTQIVMLGLPTGPLECEHILPMRYGPTWEDGIECVGLFDATNWDMDR